MEKSLDAAKAAHTVLILTSLAIGAFALAPSRTTSYEGAIQELEFVERVPEASFLEYLRRNYMRGELETFIDQQLGGESGFVSTFAGLKVLVPLYCSFPKADATVADWVRFTNDSHSKAGYYKASLKDLRAHLKQAARDFPSKWRLISIATMRADQQFWSLDACAGPFEGRSNGAITIIARVAPTKMHGETRAVTVEALSDSGTLFEYFLRWAVERGDFKRVDPSPPYLKNAGRIPELATKTVDQALFFLHEKVATGGQQISILGLTVDSQRVVWIGPVVLLLLMTYLLALTIHIRSIASPDDRAMREHPWIGAHTHWFSILAAMGSTLLLPAFVAGALAGRAWVNPRDIPWQYPGLLVLIFAFGGAHSIILASIRRMQRPIRRPKKVDPSE